jgi:hypothetical protein
LQVLTRFQRSNFHNFHPLFAGGIGRRLAAGRCRLYRRALLGVRRPWGEHRNGKDSGGVTSMSCNLVHGIPPFSDGAVLAKSCKKVKCKTVIENYT